MGLLTLTVSVVPLHLRKTMFFVALYILSVGVAGHKPCAQTFAADQFSEDSPEERKEKSSFFNWWYMGIIVAGSVAVLVVIYIQVTIPLRTLPALESFYFRDSLIILPLLRGESHFI